MMCSARRAIGSTALLAIERLPEVGRGIGHLVGRQIFTAARRLLRVVLPLLILSCAL